MLVSLPVIQVKQFKYTRNKWSLETWITVNNRDHYGKSLFQMVCGVKQL